MIVITLIVKIIGVKKSEAGLENIDKGKAPVFDGGFDQGLEVLWFS